MPVHFSFSHDIDRQPLNRRLLQQRCDALLHLLKLEAAEVSVVFMGEAFQVRGKRGRDYFGACSRKRCSFPVSVRGNWVQNSIARGYL